MNAADRFAAAVDPAMVVVTAAHGGQRDGCLVGFHGQTSIHPWRYTVWLSTANRTFRVARRARHLMVHLLDADDVPLAAWFGEHTGDTVDSFAGVAWRPGPDGVTPRLTGVRRWFLGRVEARHLADGDHAAFVLSAVDAKVPVGSEAEPALRLHDVRGLRPGHPA